MLDLLIEYGFNRTDFVYEGEFSIRGGIIDVFSLANEPPYRIELFDDEVESLRTFNPGNTIIGAQNFGADDYSQHQCTFYQRNVGILI